MHRQAPAVPRRTSDQNRDENVRFGPKADIGASLCDVRFTNGKAVISSYLVANNETWWRGIVLSFASAMLQAFAAIAIVGVAAALLGATAKAMGNTVRVIEIVSYALIMLFGLRLLWVKGRAFLRLLRGGKPAHHEHDQKHRHLDHVHEQSQ